MSLKIDRVQLEIVVQQDSARQKMIGLEERMRSANKTLSDLKRKFGENSAEYKAQQKIVQGLKIEYDKLFEEIGVGKLSLKELCNRQKELNAILRNLPGDSNLYGQYKKQLDEINLRIKELKGTADTARFSISKMADGFNKYAAISAGLVASLTGITFTARKCVDEFAQMEEAESQVRKYTGMTKEEVKDLNEEFKKMDTRTARTRLNELAGDAGRLGKTSKKDVLEFVEAANMIDVALGEDLGQDAIKNIGKLADMFGEERQSLKHNMLAIGSAVNEVAQNSSAAEPYLVEFSARMGGVAKQAKLSVTDVLGFASALDQNMLRSEMASTALQALILKLYQEPAKYAKLARMDVEQFTKLMETDANEAVLQFLASLGKLGGMDQMAPVLKQMKLSGAEAAGVISALAGNVAKVRKEQETANKAFTDGTSLEKEYAIQNSTVQAELDKAKKRFADIRVELGERLLPAMKYMVSTGSLTVKGLSEVIRIFFEYKAEIVAATASIVAYTAGVKLQALWTTKIKTATGEYIIVQKLANTWNRICAASQTLHSAAMYTFRGNTAMAKESISAFFRVLKVSPWGAALTGITAVIGALYLLGRRTDAVTKAQMTLDEINNEAIKNVSAEITKIEKLHSIAVDENLSKKTRIDAIKMLNDISPEYLGNLDLENIKTEDARKNVDKYVTSLIRQATVQEQINRLGEINAKLGKYNGDSMEYLHKEVNVFKLLWNGFTSGSAIPEWNEWIEEKKALEESLKENLKKSIEEKNKEVEAGSSGSGSGNDGGNDGETKLSKILKAREKELKEAMQSEQNLWKEDLINKKVTEEEYQQALYDTEIVFLASKKALLEKYKQDTSEVQGQIYDKMIEETNRLDKKRKEDEKKSQESLLKDVDEKYASDKQKLKEKFLSGEIKKEKDFQKQMKELEIAYLEERKKNLEKFGKDTSKISGQITDAQLDQKKDEIAAEKKTKLAEIENESSYTEKLSLLQGMYDADLVNYEEYQDWKTKITEEWEDRRREAAVATFDEIGRAASAASEIVSALQNREISKIERKYDKEIKAAKKAGKDTTQLEEEKEEAVNAIKKKYADKQFAATVLQVIATTASAAMHSYDSMSIIPIVGPVLGKIAAATAIAQGIAQIAVAKQARDEAKGLKSGGYSDEYVEGYTRSGNPDDVAGVIPVHKNEFVTNHDGVANPHVRQFLDVFDIAQKSGTIRMLNTTQILEQVRTRSGKYSGGYIQDNMLSSSVGNFSSGDLGIPDHATLVRLIVLMEKNNELLEAIQKKDIVIDSRAVRDGLKHLEKLEKNVSR